MVIDQAIYNELRATGTFEDMDLETDEASPPIPLAAVSVWCSWHNERLSGSKA
jgi:hypothetical protein